MPDDHAVTHSWELQSDGATRRPQESWLTRWKGIAWRSINEVSDNNIFLAAGGVTYAVLLALFPGMAALVSLYGLWLDAGQIEKQIDTLGMVLPYESRQMLAGELHNLASSSTSALGFWAIFGLLVAFWSASRGMSGMMSALNMAYDQRERRSFLTFNMVALVLTVGAIVGLLVTVALLAGLPIAVEFLGLDPKTKWLLLMMQWPILIAVLLIGLAMLYRYGPDHEHPRWHWFSPGALFGAALWVLGSAAFTAYVANFASYDKTYGSLGGAVVLLTWLYLSAFTVLLGAVINAQADRQP